MINSSCRKHRLVFLTALLSLGLPLAHAAAESGASHAVVTSPADGATGVALSAHIDVAFPTALDRASLTGDAVALLGSEGVVPAALTLSDDRHTIVLAPRRELNPGAHYAVTVNGVRDVDGNAQPYAGAGFSTVSLGGAPAAEVSVQRISTGDAQANAEFSAGCENTESLHGFALCRTHGGVHDGVFVPGQDNTDSRWRSNADEPELLTEARLPPSLRVAAGTTAVIGAVHRIDDQPLAGVTVAVGDVATRTDAQGRFVLRNVPAGHQVLLVDGKSANRGNEEYGEFYAAVSVADQRVNAVPFNLYVPRILARDKVTIPAPAESETVLTHPAIPGLEIHVPAGTVIRDRQGKVLTHVAIVPLPSDRSPVPLPDNFPVYFSIQPATATIEGVSDSAAAGLRIVYPNYVPNASDKPHPLWVYDAARSGWMVYATARTSPDGRQEIPERDSSLHMPMPGGYGVGGPDPSGTSPPAGGCGGGGGGGFLGGGGPMSGGGPLIGGSGGNSPAAAADPVDCYTGLFIHQVTDFAIDDAIAPVTLARTYRPNWSADLPFGTGSTHNYGYYLYNPSGDNTAPEIDLVMPNGSKIPFMHVSGNLGAGGPGLWVSHSLPDAFYGAQLINVEAEPTAEFCGICVVLRDGTTIRFPDFGLPGIPSYVQWIRDRFGNQTNFAYSGGLLTRVISPGGRSLLFTYTGRHITQVQDHTGRKVFYEYTGSQLTKVTYPDNTTEQYAYDSNGRMHTVTDRRGNLVTTNQYDSNGRVALQTLPDGTYGFSYGSGYTDVTDPRGIVRHVTFDAAGYPLTNTRAYGTALAQTKTFVRGQDELVTQETDALGRVTKFTYDANGNLLSTTYPSSGVTYSYGYTTDGFNQLASITDPLNHGTQYGYTNGCLTSVTDALGHVTQLQCNLAGQPTRITDPLGHSKNFVYDPNGDLRAASDALGRQTVFERDALGRIVATIDPLNRKTLRHYDVDSRVDLSTDALGQSTSYVYDGNGNVTQVTDPANGVTQYGYDARNRRNSRTDALNQQETWTYDGNGNVLTYTDRKLQLTRYQYDALDRLSLTTFADGSTITPTFDAGNRLTSVADSVSGTIARSYDVLDRLVLEQTPQGAVSYRFDKAGRRTGMTPPCDTDCPLEGQSMIAYTYDAADRLTEIDQQARGESVSFTYDAANRRTALTLPNGVTTAYAYDTADELTSLTYTSSTGSTLATITYAYDAAGQRTARSGGFAADLLPSATTGTNEFDLNNRETLWNGFGINYDANGDIQSTALRNPLGTYNYVFDARHRLVEIDDPVHVRQGQTYSVVAQFTYDAFNRRISKMVNGRGTSFVYDGHNAVQETSGMTVSKLITGRGMDERFARDDAVYGRTYFLADALGSTLALTDGTGAIRQEYSYEPFGEVSTSGGSDNPYQYTGRENDGTGLYYYRARYFSPAMKRFISEDPLGVGAGLNSYRYVKNDPVFLRDPTGLQTAIYTPNDYQPVCLKIVCTPLVCSANQSSLPFTLSTVGASGQHMSTDDVSKIVTNPPSSCTCANSIFPDQLLKLQEENIKLEDIKEFIERINSTSEAEGEGE